MAKTTKSPVASRTRSKRCTAITKPKNMFSVTVKLIPLSNQQMKEAMKSVLIDPTSHKYNLRKIVKVEENTTKKKKTVKSNVVATIDNMPASRLWTVLKKENKQNIVKDMFCLAKMRSYSPWPAMVIQHVNKTAEVYFFGEGTTGKVPTNEIVPFEQCLKLVTKYFSIKGYMRAIREIELALNIPYHESLTRNQ